MNYMLIGAYGKNNKAKESLWVSGTGKLPEAKRVILRGVNLLNYM